MLSQKVIGELRGVIAKRVPALRCLKYDDVRMRSSLEIISLARC